MAATPDEFPSNNTYAILISDGLDYSMHFVDAKRNDSEHCGGERPPTPIHPGSETLRRAMRRNIVSFPSQIPTLLKRPPADTQWRIVLLFFVRGWSSAKIGVRFNVPRHRIWKILNGWSVRALELGYVQVIDPEAFAACCRYDAEWGPNQNAEEMGLAEVGPVHKDVPQTATVAGALPATPDGVRFGGMPVDSQGNSADLVAALDVAIAHCEEWRGEFWTRMATLLCDLRTAAAVDLELRRSTEQTDAACRAQQGGKSRLPHRLQVHEEERVSHVSHAVA